MQSWHHIPPRSADVFLSWFCRPELAEEIQGDLYQAWKDDLDSKGAFRAGLIYWLEVILFIRSHVIRRRDPARARGSVMWSNYAKVAVRSMRRQKIHSSINLIGLAIGLACTFLLAVYVIDETSYDRYHEDADRIYRLASGMSDENYEGVAKINGPWGTTAAAEVSAIESVARFTFFGTANFQLDERIDQVYGGLYADSTTWDVFSWEVLSGDPETALIEPNSIVLVESVAKAWFGDTDPRGQQLIVDEVPHTVTAVMEDVPSNSHFDFHFLVSYSGYTDERHDDWRAWNQYYTYVKLTPGAEPTRVENDVSAMLSRNMDLSDADAAFLTVMLQPLTDIHLRSNMFREIAPQGNAQTVSVLMLLAIFVLGIAGVNFVNLSTARATLRAKEVGVRKSMGAQHGKLIRQFISESVLVAGFAGVISLGLILWAREWFNELSGKAFEVGDLLTIQMLGGSLAVVLALGLVAGIYPAFVLSSFNPTRVMKGVITSRGGVGLRRGLVGLQFVISAALIMGTGVMRDQIDYMNSKDLGFERENIVGIPFQDRGLLPQFQTIRDEMARVPGVELASLSANRPGGGDYGIPIAIPGLTREETPSARMLVVDHGYLETYSMQLAMGRGFEEGRDNGTDAQRGLLVNEAFVNELGWDDPIGQIVQMPALEWEFEIIGVLSDFHFRSLHEEIGPLIMFMAPDEWMSLVNVRIDPARTTEAIEGLTAVHERFDSTNPFAFSFMDERLDSLYEADQRAQSLLQVFTLLAILVACLGLFGLAAFSAERRRAEIGIRKVVGASEGRLVLLLVRETAVVVGIALIVALPFVVRFGAQWLESFAYSTGVQPITLVVGGLIAIGLALLTTGSQALRAARMNPVEAIRSD